VKVARQGVIAIRVGGIPNSAIPGRFVGKCCNSGSLNLSPTKNRALNSPGMPPNPEITWNFVIIYRLVRAASSIVPRTLRRAEAFIRAHAAQPIALHEVAEAAGCSVRALQLAFRQFRDTTPTAAIRQARIEAVRQVLTRGEIEGTVTDLAYQFGFTNPGRFTSFYRATFGMSPAETLRSTPSQRARSR
jgi:AraC-like DNA-binding protein